MMGGGGEDGGGVKKGVRDSVGDGNGVGASDEESEGTGKVVLSLSSESFWIRLYLREITRLMAQVIDDVADVGLSELA